MEEDIKILESECYYLEELGYLKENNHFIRFNQALKNLIKDYKEKEEIVKQLDKQIFEFSNEVVRDFIPKSKIREKIEALNNQYKEIASKYTEEELDNGEEGLDDYIEMQKIQKAENILQEILEEEV